MHALQHCIRDSPQVIILQQHYSGIECSAGGTGGLTCCRAALASSCIYHLHVQRCTCATLHSHAAWHATHVAASCSSKQTAWGAVPLGLLLWRRAVALLVEVELPWPPLVAAAVGAGHAMGRSHS